MEAILAIFVPITFIVTVGLITKWISDNRLKRDLASVSPELAETLLTSSVRNLDASLKWGIVALGVGVSLVLVQLMHLDARDPLTFGLVFMFGGIGLLFHYFMASRAERED